MKKVFCILSVLTFMSPALADPVAGEPANPSPSPVTTGTLTASTNPVYPLAAAHSTNDGNAASAGYVKGAYNSTIKAVNTIANQKQNKLVTVASTKQNKTNGDMYSQDGGLSDGKFVTSVDAANGIVTVTRKEVTIPIGEPSGTAPANRASLWIE